ncbi:PspC domain-containing protein [Levilactobacillus yonginensis]|uniref:PspC domain-containing protein n=1 Tax=Levilactobacillus yonginensis TaxID=1054041 RepID=UPI00345DA994
MKNIHRSRSNQVFAGVIGGLAEHFDWNVGVARLLFVVLTITPVFPGLIVYLILWMIMGDPV